MRSLRSRAGLVEILCLLSRAPLVFKPGVGLGIVTGTLKVDALTTQGARRSILGDRDSLALDAIEDSG